MFKLKFSTANAAFDPDARGEIMRILRVVAQHIERGEDCGVCRDVNGNTVGKWEVTTA